MYQNTYSGARRNGRYSNDLEEEVVDEPDYLPAEATIFVPPPLFHTCSFTFIEFSAANETWMSPVIDDPASETLHYSAAED